MVFIYKCEQMLCRPCCMYTQTMFHCHYTITMYRQNLHCRWECQWFQNDRELSVHKPCHLTTTSQWGDRTNTGRQETYLMNALVSTIQVTNDSKKHMTCMITTELYFISCHWKKYNKNVTSFLKHKTCLCQNERQ